MARKTAAKGRLGLNELREFMESGQEITPSKYHKGHEDRILGHIARVHTEIGPVQGLRNKPPKGKTLTGKEFAVIPPCDCDVCDGYNKTATCGPLHHLNNYGCQCKGCMRIEAEALMIKKSIHTKKYDHKKYQAKYRKKHRKQILADQARYRKKHKKELNAKNLIWYHANKEWVNAKRRAAYHKQETKC